MVGSEYWMKAEQQVNLRSERARTNSTYPNQLPSDTIIDADVILSTVTLCYCEITAVVGAKRVSWCEKDAPRSTVSYGANGQGRPDDLEAYRMDEQAWDAGCAMLAKGWQHGRGTVGAGRGEARELAMDSRAQTSLYSHD